MCSCKGKNPSGKGFHKPTVRSFLHSLRCQRFGPDAHFTHRPHPVRALSTETEVAQVKVKSEQAAVFLCRILTRPEEEEGGAKVSARLAIVCVFGKNKRSNMSKPNYSGTFHMVEQQNMDTYLAALDINFALRKIVCLLKPSKEITHDPASGAMKIRTVTTFKNFNMDFTIGEEFTEDLGPVDGRLCQTTVSWEGDKLLCVQRGEKEGRGWTHWLEGDKLHLEMRVQDIVAKQVFKKGD